MNESSVMQPGQSYRVTRPGAFIPGHGELLPVVYDLLVLKKPTRVMVEDGPGGVWVEISTPDHLMEPCWHYVHNYTKNLKHWFCDTECIIETIPSLESNL